MNKEAVKDLQLLFIGVTASTYEHVCRSFGVFLCMHPLQPVNSQHVGRVLPIKES